MKVVLTQIYLYEEDKEYLRQSEKVRGDFSREIRNAVHKRVQELKNLDRVKERSNEE